MSRFAMRCHMSLAYDLFAFAIFLREDDICPYGEVKSTPLDMRSSGSRIA